MEFYIDGNIVGCVNAVMRLYRDQNQPGEELCGKQDGQFFLSTGDYFKLE